ncbi:capsular polysaccharide synthesis protein [Georgenia alba]|uniref:Capsular polysaccharide synthesis protein n=1 Tax=Georgenia alba TaxID=2233858 RepID=A0ABW2Q7M2_9MICO
MRPDPTVAGRVLGERSFKKGAALAGEKRWEEAADAFQRAVDRYPHEPVWWRRLALARLHHGDVDAGLAAHRRSVETHPDPPLRWLGDLGKVATRARDWGTARAAYQELLRKDPETRDHDAVLLERGLTHFLPRRRTSRFIAQNIDRIRRAAARHEPLEDRSGTVWTYWAQGFENAPDVVRLAHGSLVEHMGDAVVALTATDVADLVTLPPDVDALVENHAFRSDLLRLELLTRFGGIWMDSTCFVRHDVRAELEELARPSGFFAYAKGDVTIGNWLMLTPPGHYVPAMLLEAEYAHWREFQQNLSYFTFHHIFEALVDADERFREIWHRTPRVPFDAALRFRHMLDEPYDAATYREVLDGSIVHKLTYKYDDAGPGTMIDALMSSQDATSPGGRADQLPGDD